MSILFNKLLSERRVKKGTKEFFVRECLTHKNHYEVEIIDGNKLIYSKSNLKDTTVKQAYEKFM